MQYGRPLLFWHGQQDRVVPYEDVVSFMEENKDLPKVQFAEEDEGHLVKGETMDKVTEFFVREMLQTEK